MGVGVERCPKGLGLRRRSRRRLGGDKAYQVGKEGSSFL